jgi:hypothetical protein
MLNVKFESVFFFGCYTFKSALTDDGSVTLIKNILCWSDLENPFCVEEHNAFRGRLDKKKKSKKKQGTANRGAQSSVWDQIFHIVPY